MKERKLGLLGKKVGMTQIFTEDRKALGVTVVQLGPCVVLKKASVDASGNKHNALELGFEQKPERKVHKAEAGHLKKAGGLDKARRFVREMRVSAQTLEKYDVGQEISLADLELNPGDLVDVVGTSKGKGFQGVMKRYNFAGFPASHGTSEYYRHGGSIGCRKWPGRVFKGQKMPGQMGSRRVTTQNVKVAEVRAEENILILQGAVPGAKNGYVSIRPAIKKNPVA